MRVKNKWHSLKWVQEHKKRVKYNNWYVDGKCCYSGFNATFLPWSCHHVLQKTILLSDCYTLLIHLHPFCQLPPRRQLPEERASCVSSAEGCWMYPSLWSSPGRSLRASWPGHWSFPPVGRHSLCFKSEIMLYCHLVARFWSKYNSHLYIFP